MRGRIVVIVQSGERLQGHNYTPGRTSDTPLRWQDDALCAQTDPEIFSPEKGGSTRQAKTVCASCTVVEQCLAYALQNEERFGIWGGLSYVQRRNLLRKRKAWAA